MSTTAAASTSIEPLTDIRSSLESNRRAP
jgi:hypothetical protein